MSTESFESAPPAAPMCYRHPGRETYVHCQRCGRPICPECQIPAAVGVQCPECVQAGNQSVRTPRTTFGGVIPRGDGALVTKTLIGLNVAMFVLQKVVGDDLMVRLGMVGYAITPINGGGFDVVGIADGEYYRLITATFLHAGLLHIGVNMLSLWMIGPPLEQVLGRARFLAIYLVGALGASATSYLLNAPNTIGVGASGAIFALFGALIAIARKRRLSLMPYVGVLIANAVIGFLSPTIDWRAHVGGLVTGLVLGAAMAYAPANRRNTVQWSVVGVMLVVIAGVVAFRTGQLHDLVGQT